MKTVDEKLRMLIKGIIRENFSAKNQISPPSIPNSMNFWHGGNLDNYNEIISQKNGRYEYGPGLYLTSKYDIARRYSKGSRKLYLITVENGQDIQNARLNIEVVKDFVNTYVLTKKRKLIWERLQRHIVDGSIDASIFNNTILNEHAITASNTRFLRAFLVKNNIDYEIVNNQFGFGDKTLVLYNMKKVINVITISPKDEIMVFDLA